MAEDKLRKMRELVDTLNEAADAYYNGQGERMSDYEWDAMFDQLKQLEIETGQQLPDSPTNRVSEDNITGQKEEHEFPALSLAKTKQPEELAKWAEGRPIWLSWKLDGLTLVVTFDNGKLTKVVTRGNGHVGTNITHLAPAITGIPREIKAVGHVVVRGECVISYEDFEQFNMESDEEYANPRNLASGSLTLKDVDEVRQRHLRWIPFTLVYTEEAIGSWGARMDWLETNGMKAVEREQITQPTLQNIEQVIAQWTEKVTDKENPYPVDGLVITYDDTAFAQTGSVTGHHATRAGYAFKWQDEHADTTLDHIEWSCAASTISPVAVFSPVELEGTTVKRASLCNISECERLGIGSRGTRLSVIKANKIIPKVIRVDEKIGELEIPDCCPVCGAQTRISISPASATKTLHCTNAKCPAKQLRKFARFVSKEGVNIDGISEQTVAKFINLGWVKEYADLYRLKDHAMEIAAMEGFGEKSARNLLRSIEKARDVEARRFLYALSIPLCGQDVCKRLLGAYPLREIIDIASGKSDKIVPGGDTPFALIAGIGPEKSNRIVEWFHDEENLMMVEKLLGQVRVSQESNEPSGEKCKGLTFVVTGDVTRYKNRNELKAYIEGQGGKVTGSVSKSTNYLINNDVASVSTKNQKARQLGIPVISESEFIERFGSE
ncbi:NAD-dependent DNA ligase LigA [Segatella maculosa]|uniref:NAD-dependent DNA ligase LigA n=1 Tax=Segatella maculosa TaxID=439703 RepID=UPI0028D2C49B|nr:NAD-dependent DNA ligase LigA [Segatella maculosa]